MLGAIGERVLVITELAGYKQLSALSLDPGLSLPVGAFVPWSGARLFYVAQFDQHVVGNLGDLV